MWYQHHFCDVSTAFIYLNDVIIRRHVALPLPVLPPAALWWSLSQAPPTPGWRHQSRSHTCPCPHLWASELTSSVVITQTLSFKGCLYPGDSMSAPACTRQFWKLLFWGKVVKMNSVLSVEENMNMCYCLFTYKNSYYCICLLWWLLFIKYIAITRSFIILRTFPLLCLVICLDKQYSLCFVRWYL